MYTLGESEIMLEIEILKRAKYQFDIKRTTLKSDSYDHNFQRPNFIHNHSIFWRFGSGAPDSEPLCLRDVPALVSTWVDES